jgi:gliding motility-associated-like protein
VAGYISYQKIPGTAHSYRVRLHVYRDCAGISVDNSYTLGARSLSGCAANKTFTVTRLPAAQGGGPTLVTPVCPGQTTTCTNGSSNIPGIQENIYEGTVDLGAACPDWEFSWGMCCRNNGINTIQSPGSQDFYVFARLNSTVGDNNSAQFLNRPVPFICQGQQHTITNGAFDPDGDSLVYTVVTPFTSATSNVNYLAGYSAAQSFTTSPANGIIFNPITGAYTGTPSTVQSTVVAFRVDEYRDINGVPTLVGSIIRDIQIIVLPAAMCTNQPAATGLNNVFGPGAVFSYSGCPGAPMNFTINAQDPDPGQNLTLSASVPIPGATFTITGNGTPSPVFTFNWLPTPADVSATPYLFTITVQDDACPIQGTNTFTYQVYVENNFNVSVTVPPVCAGQSSSLTANVNPAANPPNGYGFLWSGPLGFTSTSQNPTFTFPAPGAYTVTCQVTDLNGGCIAAATNAAVVRDTPQVNVIPANPLLCNGGQVQLTATSTDPGASGWTWTPAAGLSATNVNNPIYNSAGQPAGTVNYQVAATGANGCIGRRVVPITVAPPPPPAECNTIFVTPTGNPVGAGTKADPVTLARAFELARCNGSHIKIAFGVYNTDTTITGLTDFVVLEGGYDPGNGWVKTNHLETRIVRSRNNPILNGGLQHVMAFMLNSVNNFRFQDLTIECQDLTTGTNGNSASSYGVHLTNCSGYAINRCIILAGDATNGVSGSNGTNGANGGNGGNGSGSSAGAAGASVGGNPGGAGGAGGSAGGASGGPGGVGGTGAIAGAGGGIGGTSGTPFNGGICGINDNPGGTTRGGNGAPGAAGQGRNTNPAAFNGANGVDGYVAGFYVPGNGTNGINGETGHGGGGGGGGGGQGGEFCFGFNTNDPGGGGGGGGGGGQGGTAGTAGTGGGGSFPLFLVNNGAGASVTDCELVPGANGAAGTGGTGGIGGNGGNGGNGVDQNDSGDGGNGGAGGRGGDGGNGGSGSTGAAVRVFVNGTAPTVQTNGAPQAIVAGTNNPANYNFAPEPDISIGVLSCTLNDITFTHLGGTPAIWNFGAGGGAAQNGANVVTQYSSVGVKTVAFGATTLRSFYTINSTPGNTLPNIVLSDTVVCQGNLLQFFASSQLTASQFLWTVEFLGNNPSGPVLGTDATISNTLDTVLNYAYAAGTLTGASGYYRIRLQINSDCCGLTPPVTTLFRVAPRPLLDLGPDFALCHLDQQYIHPVTNTGQAVFWNGGTVADSILIVANPVGTINVTAYSYNFALQCSSLVDNLAITVNALPTVNVTPASQEICDYEQATFSVTGTSPSGSNVFNVAWYGLGSSVPTGSQSNVTLPPALQVQFAANQANGYQFEVTDANGCSASDTVFFSVNAGGPRDIQALDITPCFGDTTTVYNSGFDVNAWYWILPIGASITDTAGPLVIVEGAGSISFTQAYTAPASFIMWMLGSNGCVNTVPDTITITPQDLPDFVFTNAINGAILGCGPQSINTSADDSGYVAFYNFAWQLSTNGGGTFNPIATSPNLSDTSNITTQGLYTLTITNLVTGCLYSDTVYVLPSVSPQVNGPTSVCEDASAAYTSDSAVTWTLNPVAGLGTLANTTPTATDVNFASVASNQTLTLIATNTNFGLNCSTEVSISVVAEPDFAFSPSQVVGCGPQLVGTNANTALPFVWELSTDGGATFVPFAGFTSASGGTATQSGIYRLTLTGPAPTSCTFTDEVTVTINPIPVITTAPVQVCAASTNHALLSDIVGDWSSVPASGVLSVTGVNTTMALFDAANLTALDSAIVIVTTPEGCADSATVRVNPLPVFSAGPYSFCQGGSGTFDVATSLPSLSGFVWTDLANNPVANGPSITVSAPQTLVLTATETATGCTDSTLVEFVEVERALLLPVADTVCRGGAAILQAQVLNPSALQPSGQYIWTHTTSGIVTTVQMPDSTLTVSPLNADSTYSVVYAVGACSSDVATVTALLAPTPQAVATANPGLPATLEDPNLSVALQSGTLFYYGPSGVSTTQEPAGGGVQYFWTFAPVNGMQNPLSGASVTQNFPNRAEVYTVSLTVRVTTGGVVCQDSIVVGTVTVREREQIFIPNVFTPNGDGSNDGFRIQTTGIRSVKVLIFDRWGTLINEANLMNLSDGTTEVWNGNTKSGSQANEGVYYYVIEAESANGNTINRSGSVSLLR